MGEIEREDEKEKRRGEGLKKKGEIERTGRFDSGAC